MKKLVPFLLLLVLCFGMALSVQADVIFEPQDAFYKTHVEECEYINRCYLAAGAGESTTVYKSPTFGLPIAHFPNGEKLYVEWQWNEWLYADIGWVHQEDVSLVYDTDSFFFDHTEDTPDYQDDGYSTPVFLLYTYPNSGECTEVTEDPDYATVGESIKVSYLDEDGLQWGFVGYYMANSGWVCLDDPTNDQLDSGAMPVVQSISQQRGSDADVSSPLSYLVLATGLVLAVVAVTVVLLLRKKKSSR